MTRSRQARTLWRAATLAWFGAKLAVLAVNAATFPRLSPAAADVADVSVLVPARDEAHNLRHTLPPLLAQGAREVLVLDDASRDGTGDLARGLGATVLTTTPLPAGWLGKQWACQRLGAAASGELLCFVDADTRFTDGALAALVATRERLGVDVLTVLPRAVDLPFGAHLLTPLIENLVLTFLPYPLLGVPHPDVAWGCGATVLIDRATYERIGGFERVRDVVLSDVAQVREAKRAGARIGQALGGRLVGVRMYGSWAESLEGYAKSVREVHLGSRGLMLASAAWHLAAYTLPWLLPAKTRTDRALRALSLAERALVPLLTHRPRDVWEALLSPVTPLAALPGYAAGARRRRRWKGRQVPLPRRSGPAVPAAPPAAPADRGSGPRA